MRSKVLFGATWALWMGVCPHAVAERQAVGLTGTGSDNGRSRKDSRGPTRSGTVQGHHQRLDSVWRPAAGHGSHARRRSTGSKHNSGVTGCTNIARLAYSYQPPSSAAGPAATVGSAAQADNAASGAAGGVSGGVAATTPTAPTTAVGGGRPRGVRAPTGVNTDPNAQPDPKLRQLNSQPSTPGPREEVYCTKIGTTHPDEMYIVSGHMDGIGWGEAANDDGSGTALVMELARVFSSPDVRDRSLDPFHSVEQRGDRINGSRATSISARLCRARKIRRDQEGTRSRSGSE